jgi:hypothetical protein
MNQIELDKLRNLQILAMQNESFMIIPDLLSFKVDFFMRAITKWLVLT